MDNKDKREQLIKMLEKILGVKVSNIHIIDLDKLKISDEQIEERMIELLSSNNSNEIELFLNEGLANMDNSIKERELLKLYDLLEERGVDSPNSLGQDLIIKKLKEITDNKI